MSRILIPTSTTGFDPTEVAVPWKILRNSGHDIFFATDTGTAGSADPLMLEGQGFGILKPFLIAEKSARQAYAEMLQNPEMQSPIRINDIDPKDFGAILLPGGHAKGMIPYLESTALHQTIAEFFKANKPVGAICHGVVAACRSINRASGKSVLFGRKTTALLNRQELLAWNLTKRKHGDYYRTYPITVEDEVRSTLEFATDFNHGPLPILRDSPKKLLRGFTLRDGNYLSARWPGDAYSFAFEFDKMLKEITP